MKKVKFKTQNSKFEIIIKASICLLLIAYCQLAATAQDANTLVQKVKIKLESVSDYVADAKMKTNISFLKVPLSNVKVYYKKPNKLKVKNEKGISFVPKGAVNMNMANLIGSGKYTVLDIGKEKIGTTSVQIVKLLPEDDNADVVLSTLYIDIANAVILKAKTTTKENGTYELQMTYGKYITNGLPDKIVFSFNTKDYKMPKGVTFDFEDGTKANKQGSKSKPQKGTIDLEFYIYTINKGVADSNFQ